MHEGQHEAIIEEAEWDAVQELLSSDARRPRDATSNKRQKTSASLLCEKLVDEAGELLTKFGLASAQRFRIRSTRPSGRWHLDDVFVRIGGKAHYLRRAVDDEGEVLDVLVQAKRNLKAAPKHMRKFRKRQAFLPDGIVTDRLRSYGATLRELGLTSRLEIGRSFKQSS